MALRRTGDMPPSEPKMATFTDTDIRHSAWMKYAQQNASMAEQNGCHSADDIYKCIFLQENVRISTQISLSCASEGVVVNELALV